MVIAIPVPRLGMSGTTSRIAQWYAEDGATVRAGEPICCLEFGTVSMDMEADAEGILRHRFEAGEVREPGEVLGVILAPGERMPELDLEDEDDRAEDAVPQELPLPVATLDDEEAELAALQAALAESDASAEPEWSSEPIVFPRRFHQAETPETWSEVPGDRADFDTGLWPVPSKAGEDEDLGFEGRLEVEPTTEELPEPGGAIPDLPVWEEPDERFAKMDEVAPHAARPRIDAPGRATIPVAGRVLLRTTVSLVEVRKLVEQVTREWSAEGVAPLVEDVAARAVARAVREAEGGSPVVRIQRSGAGGFGLVDVRPVAGSLKDAVRARGAGSHADSVPEAVITSYIGSRIEDAEPGAAARFAFTLGCERERVELHDGAAVAVPVASVALRADETVNDDSAARLLSRVRELLEAPYALLVD